MNKENTPLLEMRNIKKDFFGNQVLSDINLTLNEGEVIGLVGENGAGKSTLMRILFGADMIRETGGYGGEVLLNGEVQSFNSPFDAIEAGMNEHLAKPLDINQFLKVISRYKNKISRFR